jgi:hypothetical protein
MTPSLHELAGQIRSTFARYLPQPVAPASAELLARRESARDCMRRKRAAWRAQGLNAAGKPKKADNGRTLRK